MFFFHSRYIMWNEFKYVLCIILMWDTNVWHGPFSCRTPVSRMTWKWPTWGDSMWDTLSDIFEVFLENAGEIIDTHRICMNRPFLERKFSLQYYWICRIIGQIWGSTGKIATANGRKYHRIGCFLQQNFPMSTESFRPVDMFSGISAQWFCIWTHVDLD